MDHLILIYMLSELGKKNVDMIFSMFDLWHLMLKRVDCGLLIIYKDLRNFRKLDILNETLQFPNSWKSINLSHQVNPTATYLHLNSWANFNFAKEW